MILNSWTTAGAALESSKRFSAHKEKEAEIKPLEPRDKWAVLVAVDTPQNPAFGSFTSSEANVKTLFETLRNHNAGHFWRGHVRVVDNEKATTAGIKSAVFDDWLLQRALPNDLIVLYFCGRVLPSTDHSDAVFCSFDISEDSPTSSGVPIKRLLFDLHQRSQCKNIVCILDTEPARDATMKQLISANDLPKVQDVAQDCHVAVLAPDQLFHRSENTNTFVDSFTKAFTDAISAAGGETPLQNVAEDVIGTVTTTDRQAMFFPNPENPQLSLTPVGVTTKLMASFRSLRIGYPLDTLATTRPDLAAGEPAKTPIDGAALQNSAREREIEHGSDLVAPDVDFQPYLDSARRQIEGKWIPAKGFEDRRVVAVFSITRNGSIVNPAIAESSGADPADSSALAALRSASPLPPLPDGSPESVQVRFKFDQKLMQQRQAQ